MDIDQLLKDMRYNEAIHQFVQTYSKVNCILMIPVENSHIMMQLPVTHGTDKKDICRFDYILSDPDTEKVLRHGFMQFQEKLIMGYTYRAGMLALQIQPNYTLKFIGS